MKKNKRINWTALILILIFMALFLTVIGRFTYIQLTGEVKDVELEKWAKETRQTSVTLPASRGMIYDQNKMVLAYNRPTYRIYGVLDPEFSRNRKTPQHIVDPDKTAAALAPILDLDKKEIKDKITKGQKNKRFQVEFGKNGKNLSKETKEEIEKLALPGINFIEDQTRYYPNGIFASHILGFSRVDEDTQEQKGISGIEKVKNDDLLGEDGYIRYDRDKFNSKLLNPDEMVQRAKNGNDIYLTIDQKVQTLLEDVLTQVEKQYDPERITAVVSNAKTGEIVAMSNRPSFNPNDPRIVKNWYNDVISTPFEVGSTMKIFTWAAAIEDGSYKGDKTFKSGRYQINEKVQVIRDHNDGDGWGRISFDEGFYRSSNVAASKLVWEEMGTDVFLDYLKKFDFDKKTDIDLPSEATGKILYDWPAEKLTTAFGQGSTFTPMQLVKAASAIVNEGEMLQPYVIKKIVDSTTGETIEENTPQVVGQPISADTAKQMIELMDGVVSNKVGTAKSFQLDAYSVIGKTGTSQLPDAEQGGYLTGSYNKTYSFLGIAPKDDPQLIMHVSVKKPKLAAGESGSTPVSFIFKNVMENGLHYLNIEPDIKKDVQDLAYIEMPELVDGTTKQAKETLKTLKANYKIIGKGKKITATNYDPGDSFYINQQIIAVTDKPTMPKLKGWSARDILSFAETVGIDVQFSGEGFAAEQSINAGTAIKEDMKLTVKLAKPATKK